LKNYNELDMEIIKCDKCKKIIRPRKAEKHE